MKRITCFLLFSLSLCLTACQSSNEPTTTSGGSNMNITAPFVEPCLDWSVTYKGLLNIMEQSGFVSTRITASKLYYDYYSRYELVETAVLTLDTAQCYRGAEITVKSTAISRSDISKYLSQQYTQTGSTAYPSPETFYRSKTKTDSVLVSLRVEDGYPVITYTKGMN